MLCGENVRPMFCAFRGSDEFNLHAVDTVDAVDEENKDEYEADLHIVLDLGDNGALRDEAATRGQYSKQARRQAG